MLDKIVCKEKMELELSQSEKKGNLFKKKWNGRDLEKVECRESKANEKLNQLWIVCVAMLRYWEEAMAGQHYCLRWNNYQSNMTSVFHQLLRTEAFVDVTLACNEETLKAHKVCWFTFTFICNKITKFVFRYETENNYSHL